jgi:hypothetical protein
MKSTSGTRVTQAYIKILWSVCQIADIPLKSYVLGHRGGSIALLAELDMADPPIRNNERTIESPKSATRACSSLMAFD